MRERAFFLSLTISAYIDFSSTTQGLAKLAPTSGGRCVLQASIFAIALGQPCLELSPIREASFTHWQISILAKFDPTLDNP